jgi:hypothetical protein
MMGGGPRHSGLSGSTQNLRRFPLLGHYYRLVQESLYRGIQVPGVNLFNTIIYAASVPCLCAIDTRLMREIGTSNTLLMRDSVPL